jgi:hypothetical protein
MSLRARDQRGEELELVAFDGSAFELIGPRAIAPGQPMALDLLGGVGQRLELKSTGSRRREDGRFLVRARATTLTKGARELLERAFPR